MTANSSKKFTPPDLDKEQPFRGLISFQDTEKDRATFGGRDTDIKALVESVRHNVLTVFYGYSGTGKTSLLKAGAMPILREAGYRPIYIRLKFKRDKGFPDLVEQVKLSIEEDVEWGSLYPNKFEVDHVDSFETDIIRQKETLWEYFTKYGTTETKIVPVLIFDQFEEIFTLGSDLNEWVQDLIKELHCLIENQLPQLSNEKFSNNPVYFNPPPQKFRVIFSIREDYAPKLNRYKDKIYSIDKAKVGLDDLNVEAVGDVIEKIQKYFNISYFDSDQIKLLKDYLQSQQNNHGRQDPVSITLGLLCFQLNEYRRAKGKSKIDKTWLRPRFLENLIGNYYSNANIKRRTRKLIENSLVDKYGHRLSIPEEHFTEKKKVTADEMDYLVNEKRILRYESRLGSKDIEIVHDKLAARILEYKHRRMTWIKWGSTGTALVTVMILFWSLFYYWKERDKIAADSKKIIEEATMEVTRAREDAILAKENATAEKQKSREEADRIKSAAQSDIDQLKSKLNNEAEINKISSDSNIVATKRKKLAEDRANQATNLANQNLELFKNERIKVLKLYAKTYLESNPQDHKRALLYALHGLKIDSTDADLNSLLIRAVASSERFYTIMDQVSPDSLTIYFRSGQKLVINNNSRMGVLIDFPTRTKSFFDGLVQGDDLPVNTKRLRSAEGPKKQSAQLSVLVKKSTDEKLLTYFEKSKLTVWSGESGRFKLVFTKDAVTNPVFSKDNLNVAYYENSKFKISSIYNPTDDRVRPLQKKSNWFVADLSVIEHGDSARYVVLQVNEKKDEKKQIVIRKISGGSEKDMHGSPGPRILAMDYFPASGNVLGYYQTAIRLRNWERDVDMELSVDGWKEAQNVITHMVPKENAVVVFKKGRTKSQLFLIKENDAGNIIAFEFAKLPGNADRVSSIRVHGKKILISYTDKADTQISLFNVDAPNADPISIAIPEHVIDATFWLNKYVLFQTATGAYLWHFNMTKPGNTRKAIQEFYDIDKKKYPEFWEIADFDKELFNAAGGSLAQE